VLQAPSKDAIEEGSEVFLAGKAGPPAVRQLACEDAGEKPALMVAGQIVSAILPVTQVYPSLRRRGSDRGSPNHGSTLLSKRVMAQIRSPVRVRTRRPVP
jgi:hypothetical protein